MRAWCDRRQATGGDYGGKLFRGTGAKEIPESSRPCAPVSVLPERRFSRILRNMEVHFTPEQEAQLAHIASAVGTDAERLVKDAALRLLREDARFRAAVRDGVAQADRGEFIEEEEMDARFEEMLRS
jgi:predicted transcriptional regulator